MKAVLEILAGNALAAAMLAGAVLVATLVIRRPAVRNALWLIVVVRLLLPPIWSVPVVETEGEAAPVAVAQQGAIDEPIALPRESVESLQHLVIPPPSPAPIDFETPLPPPLVFEQLTVPPRLHRAESAASDEPAAVTAALNAPVPSPSPARTPMWLFPTLFALWLIGAVTVAILAFQRIRRFQRALADAICAPDHVQGEAATIARRMGLKDCPTVWLVPGRVPPLLWRPGIAAARLIFPIELFFKLNLEQRAALLAHELAHLKRHDPWVRWLELLASALYWWHPLLGLIRRRLRATEEQCCDAWVVGLLAERKAYATALVETVDFLDGPANPAPALASGAGPVHDLQGRLTMIMRGTTTNRLTRFGALAVLGVAVGALAIGPAFTSAQPEESKDRKFRPLPPKGEGDREGKEKDRPFPPRDEGKDFDKDRPFPPKDKDFDRDRPKDGPANEEIERARQEFEKARQEAEKAMERVRDAQERLARLTRERGGPDGPKGPPMRGEGKEPDGFRPPFPPPFGGGPGGQRQLQEMQKQIEEMKSMIEDLRKELRREPKGILPPMGKDFRKPMDNNPDNPPKRNFDGPKGKPFEKKDDLPPPREKNKDN